MKQPEADELTKELREVCKKFKLKFIAYGGLDNDNQYCGGLTTVDGRLLKSLWIDVIESSARTLQFCRESLRNELNNLEKRIKEENK